MQISGAADDNSPTRTPTSQALDKALVDVQELAQQREKLLNSVIMIQRMLRLKMLRDQIQLKLELNNPANTKGSKVIWRTWIKFDGFVDSRMLEIRILQKNLQKSQQYCLDAIDVEPSKDIMKKKYNQLIESSERIQFWKNLDNAQFNNYLDVDVDNKTMQFSCLYFRQFNLTNTGQPAGQQKYDLKSIKKIQSQIRGALVRKVFQYKLDHNRRISSKMNSNNSQLLLLGKSCYLFEDTQPFILSIFLKPASSHAKTKEEEENSLINKNINILNKYNPNSNNDADHSWIIVTALPIPNSCTQGVHQQVKEAKQKLSQNADITIIKRYTSEMLHESSIKLIRNQLRVIAPNIQQTMHAALNAVLIKEGKQPKYLDPNFKAKQYFNFQILQDKRRNYNSLVDICSFDVNNSRNLMLSDIGHVCQRKIAFGYLNSIDSRKVDILVNKQIKTHDDLQEKALLDHPSSDFSKKLLAFMDKREYLNEEEEQEKRELLGRARPKMQKLVALEMNCAIHIGEDTFEADVYYDKVEKDVIIISQNVAQQSISQISQLLIRFNQLNIAEWNINTLKANLQVKDRFKKNKYGINWIISFCLQLTFLILPQELVLKRLKAKNSILYFDEQSLQEIATGFEGKILIKSSENEGTGVNKKTKRIQNSINTNDCEHNGKASLGRFTIDGIDVDVVLNYPESQLILISKLRKRILKIPFSNFDSPYFSDCLTNLSVADIILRFGSIIQELSNTFVKQGEQEVLVLSTKIVLNMFALRIQRAIRKRQAILAFSAMKDFKKKSKFILGSYEIALDDGRLKKQYVLQKSAFTVMLQITRTFNGQSTKQIQKVYAINLLEWRNKLLTMDQTNKEQSHHPQISFLLDDQFGDLCSGIHPRSYYQLSLRGIIQYLEANITVNALNSLVFVQVNDKLIELKEKILEKPQLNRRKIRAATTFMPTSSYRELQVQINESNKNNSSKTFNNDKHTHRSFGGMLGWIFILQRAIQKWIKKNRKEQTRQQKKKDAERQKKDGFLVKRTFQVINGTMFLINVYQKDNVFTFILHQRDQNDKIMQNNNNDNQTNSITIGTNQIETKNVSPLPQIQTSQPEKDINYFEVNNNTVGDSDNSDVGIVQPKVIVSKNQPEKEQNIPLVSCLSSPVKIKQNNKRISFQINENDSNKIIRNSQNETLRSTKSSSSISRLKLNSMESSSTEHQKNQHNQIKITNNNNENNNPIAPQAQGQYRCTYEYDTNKLLNLGSLSVPQYLLQRLQLVGNQIIFAEGTFEDVLFSETNQLPLQLAELQHSEINSATSSTGLPSGNSKYLLQTKTSNLVNYYYSKQDDKTVIYNVIYTGEKPQTIARDGKHSDSNNNEDNDDNDNINPEKNLVQINVDLQQLKTLYPSVNTQSTDLMKVIGEQLIQGIRLNPSGQLAVDTAKINPNCIQIVSSTQNSRNSMTNSRNGQQNNNNNIRTEMNSVAIDKQQGSLVNEALESLQLQQTESLAVPKLISNQLSQYLNINQSTVVTETNSPLPIERSQLSQQPCPPTQQQLPSLNPLNVSQSLNPSNNTSLEKRRILLKQTRFFSKQKYLILIHLLEKKVHNLSNKSYDNVFEEYESSYLVSCVNMTVSSAAPILWEISPEELLVVSGGLKDHMERARYILKNVQVLSENIIFTVPDKRHYDLIKPHPNLLVFNQQGLAKIQRHFRNRRWLENYKAYYNEILSRKREIIHRCIPAELKNASTFYLLVCFERKDKKEMWELVLWNFCTFERYSMEIRSSELLQYASEFTKAVVIEYLARFLDIEETHGILELNLLLSAMEGLKKGREELKKMKERSDISRLKKKERNNISNP